MADILHSNSGASLALYENIPLLSRVSSTSATLPATFNGQTTKVMIGSQLYTMSGALTLSTATVGAGGLDTGALARNTLWRVFAIVHQTTNLPALVASQALKSTGPTMPSGYSSAFRMVGEFCVQDLASGIATELALYGDNAYAQANYALSNVPISNVAQVAARIEQLPAGAIWEISGSLKFNPAHSSSPYPTSGVTRVEASISTSSGGSDSVYMGAGWVNANNGGPYASASNYTHMATIPSRRIIGTGQVIYLVSIITGSFGWGTFWDAGTYIIARKVGDI